MSSKVVVYRVIRGIFANNTVHMAEAIARAFGIAEGSPLDVRAMEILAYIGHRALTRLTKEEQLTCVDEMITEYSPGYSEDEPDWVVDLLGRVWAKTIMGGVVAGKETIRYEYFLVYPTRDLNMKREQVTYETLRDSTGILHRGYDHDLETII